MSFPPAAGTERNTSFPRCWSKTTQRLKKYGKRLIRQRKGEFNMAMELTFGLAAVNIAILLAVLYVYVQNYIAMKARFTLGLILFAVLLLLENSLSLYFNYTMMKMFSPVETELLY